MIVTRFSIALLLLSVLALHITAQTTSTSTSTSTTTKFRTYDKFSSGRRQVGIYTFVPSADSTGYDLENVSSQHLSEAQLIAKCEATEGCVGFTSTGQLKYYIQPYSQWKRSTSNTTALYYKPSWFVFAPKPCPCGTTQTFNIICSDPGLGKAHSGLALADNKCTTAKPPPTKGECPKEKCSAFAWKKGEWSKCNAACSSGMQTRTVECVDAAGRAGADALCKNTKPRTTKPCNTHACKWSTSDFGTCSAPCGGGTSTSTLTCTDPKTGVNVDKSLCAKVATPPSSQPCNTHACTWVSHAQQCSQLCGGGLRTNTVSCQDPVTKNTVTNSLCKGTPPASSQPCNTHSCTWFQKPFSTCSNKCGGGTQTAVVQCRDPNTQAPVDDKYCTGAAPRSSKACNTHSCKWKAGAWTHCSQSCGGGVRTNRPSCVDPVSGAVLKAEACGKAPAAVTSEACNTHKCKWHSTQWSSCSASCGSGVQKSKVTCIDPNSNKIVDDKQCPATSMPPSSRACNTQKCVGFQWKSSEWTKCTADCGTGSHTRTVSCVGDDGSVDKTGKKCSTTPTPATTEACNTHKCAWKRSAFSTCSRSCGGGITSRTVACSDPKTGKNIDKKFCDKSTEPQAQKSCNTQACAWVSNPQLCSKRCGGGKQTIQVLCQDPRTKNVVDSAWCNTTKPITEQACNTHACEWKLTPFSECSQACGAGTQKALASCIDPVTSKFVKEIECPAATKPATTKQCNSHKCQWKENPSHCTRACGGGKQRVQAKCTDPVTKNTVKRKWCTDPAPPQSRICNTHACVWSSAPWYIYL